MRPISPTRVPVVPRRAPVRRSRSGQAILESFAIILLLCLILFGCVQLVLMYTAREINQYAADAAVRARTVGFNRFMVYKVMRVAGIANSGRMVTPEAVLSGDADAWNQLSAGQSFDRALRANPRSRQFWEVEQWTIPLYLGAQHYAQLPGILDYADWDRLEGPVYSSGGQTVGVQVGMRFPLRMPLWRAFSSQDFIRLQSEARLADHASLYLE
jgi:hypothetical protein